MYLDNVEDDLIDLAIYTRGSKGQIIALKGLCEQIIVKKNKIKNNNIKINSVSQEQIDEIHARGHITVAEKGKEWKSMDLCAPGDAIGSAANRCHEFNLNCHDCLVDYASAQEEYEPIELKVCNSFMNDFMAKLNNGEIKRDTCPQVGREFTGTEEVVNSELESYQRLLDSGIIDEATKEEQGPVKKLVPIKNNSFH